MCIPIAGDTHRHNTTGILCLYNTVINDNIHIMCAQRLVGKTINRRR